MSLETKLSQDDLRIMADAIKTTNLSYEARYLPMGRVSVCPTILDDDEGHIVISLETNIGYTPVKVVHFEDEAKVDGICHEEIMEYLMNNTRVFEGQLYDKNCRVSKNEKGTVNITSVQGIDVI